MRIPNPRLLRLAGLTAGAITEEGDAEILVSPLVQPIIELQGPVTKMYGTLGLVPATIPQLDSFFAGFNVTQGGVAAATNTVIATLSKGAWVLELEATIIATIQASQLADIGWKIRESAAASSASLLAMPWSGVVANQSMQASKSRSVHMIFQNDGVLLEAATVATIAAELIGMSLSVNARRIL